MFYIVHHNGCPYAYRCVVTCWRPLCLTLLKTGEHIEWADMRRLYDRYPL